jgi:hypothetical protein
MAAVSHKLAARDSLYIVLPCAWNTPLFPMGNVLREYPQSLA